MTAANPAHDPAHDDRAWTIPAAAAIAVLEAVALAVVLAFRGTRTAPFFIVCLAVKIPFCLLLVRRWAGAWLAILLWELTGVFAAVVAPRIPLALRALELALAGGVVGLLVACLPLFPRMELPSS
jgi:hypothetical protein